MNRILKLALIGTALLLAGLAFACPPVALADSGQILSREYAWSSDRLALDIPADVHFHPGTSWHLIIRAPEHVLDQLVVENGRIKSKSHGCFSLVPFCIEFGTHIGHKVDIDLTGPALRAIEVDGAATVDLDGLHQDSLRVKIDGDATVRGSGSVDDANFDIDGAGAIHLAQLTEKRAQVVIHGSGTVDIAPTDSVSVRIDGAGTVRMHSNPLRVSSHIDGAGEVMKVPAGARGTAPAH